MMSVSTQAKLTSKRQKPSKRKGPQPATPSQPKTPAQSNQPRSNPLKPPTGKNPIKQQVRIPGHRG